MRVNTQRHTMTLVEKMQLDFAVSQQSRDEHHNGTDTPGDDPGWSFYNGVMDGLKLVAREIGVDLKESPASHIAPVRHHD